MKSLIGKPCIYLKTFLRYWYNIYNKYVCNATDGCITNRGRLKVTIMWSEYRIPPVESRYRKNCNLYAFELFMHSLKATQKYLTGLMNTPFIIFLKDYSLNLSQEIFTDSPVKKYFSLLN